MPTPTPADLWPGLLRDRRGRRGPRRRVRGDRHRAACAGRRQHPVRRPPHRSIATATHLLSTVPPGARNGGDGTDPLSPDHAKESPQEPAHGDPVLGALCRRDRRGAASALDRLPVQHRRLWRPRRRLGGRGHAARAVPGTRPAPPGRGNRLGRVRRPAARVDMFRLAGIYGPGRSAFDDLRSGRARRIVKPGHAFGRIHRDDIAAAVLAAMRQDRAPGRRMLNLADDDAGGIRIGHRGSRPPAGHAAAARRRVRRRRAGHEPDGAQLLGGEPQGRQPQDASDAGADLALSELSRGATCHPPRGAPPTVRHSSARSCGRDSRWSPSFTTVTCTSALVTRSAMRSAISQGTSGSAWPCSSRTGQSSSIGADSSRWLRPSSIKRAGDRGRDRRTGWAGAPRRPASAACAAGN